MESRPTKVLVIEDDDYSREVLALILEAEGYEMESAGEGGDGYRCATEMQPDVIVLDLGMPGIDGKEFISLLRADPALRDTPILVVTGNELEGQAALTLGADRCFIKPVNFEELVRSIGNVTRNAAPASENHQAQGEAG
jgi:DNA-binding response OmpR family regulator